MLLHPAGLLKRRRKGRRPPGKFKEGSRHKGQVKQLARGFEYNLMPLINQEKVKMFSRTNAVLIIIDIQGNLAQAMYDKENLFTNSVKLIQGFKALNLPIIFTEQIPQKLGKTLPVISQAANI
jgi:hypothetical protein